MTHEEAQKANPKPAAPPPGWLLCPWCNATHKPKTTPQGVRSAVCDLCQHPPSKPRRTRNRTNGRRKPPRARKPLTSSRRTKP